MPLRVTPKHITLHGRDTQVLQAAEAAGTVTWSIEPHSGHIDANGVYTAPLLVPRNTNVTVEAHDGTQFDAANAQSMSLTLLPCPAPNRRRPSRLRALTS